MNDNHASLGQTLGVVYTKLCVEGPLRLSGQEFVVAFSCGDAKLSFCLGETAPLLEQLRIQVVRLSEDEREKLFAPIVRIEQVGTPGLLPAPPVPPRCAWGNVEEQLEQGLFLRQVEDALEMLKSLGHLKKPPVLPALSKSDFAGKNLDNLNYVDHELYTWFEQLKVEVDARFKLAYATKVYELVRAYLASIHALTQRREFLSALKSMPRRAT